MIAEKQRVKRRGHEPRFVVIDAGSLMPPGVFASLPQERLAEAILDVAREVLKSGREICPTMTFSRPDGSVLALAIPHIVRDVGEGEAPAFLRRLMMLEGATRYAVCSVGRSIEIEDDGAERISRRYAQGARLGDPGVVAGLARELGETAQPTVTALVEDADGASVLRMMSVFKNDRGSFQRTQRLPHDGTRYMGPFSGLLRPLLQH